MSLVSTKWLFENKERIKIIDSSWHLPNEDRNGNHEYNLEHILNAVFFDIDKNSDQSYNLPHMLPKKNQWEELIASMGISNDDEIVIYDSSNVISSCRLWFTFLFFGHSNKLVHVLNGGFNKWKKENFPTTNEITRIDKSKYNALVRSEMVVNIKEINQNIEDKIFKLIDGRSMDRFLGKVKEPRKGLRNGSIKNSLCLPYKNVLNSDKTFKSTEELKKIFSTIIPDLNNNNLVFTCGSGITSCVLALAYSLINNNYKPTIYDGSWAEYGKV